MKSLFKKSAIAFILLSALFPWSSAHAAGMNDYSITPPFIQESINPNLLLMIDNSSSMYDLAYSDQGQISSGTVNREPFYCFDETYKSTISYAGYFKTDVYYVFDFTNKYFTSSAFDSTKCSKIISNTLCVGINSSNQVNYFGAKGNYLNWLTSSKFDVEKNVLTGGKYVSKLCSGTDHSCNTDSDCSSGQSCTAVTTSFLQGESRGCVGQSFIKTALSGDFINFATGTTDPNKNNRIGITFAVHGPVDSVNPSAPSRGGQTYIDIFNGVYDNQSCQDAVIAWATADKQAMDDYTATCIGYNTSSQNPNYCSGNQTILCPNNLASECIVTTSAQPGNCNGGPYSGLQCTSDTACNTTTGTCDSNSGNKSGNSCSANNQCVQSGTCDASSNKKDNPCMTNSDCYQNLQHPGNCVGAQAGNCVITMSTNYTCDNLVTASSTDYGPCVNPTQSAVVKTKVAYTHTINVCSAYLKNGNMTNGDVTTYTNSGDCTEVYKGWGICSNDSTKTCAVNSDCGSGNTCIHGPSSILPGNPALVCGNDYLGAYYTGSSPDWDKSAWSSDSAGKLDAFKRYCSANMPTVIDPSDTAASSTNYEQFPSILIGTGVESQLGTPIGSLPVRLNTNSTPTGLIQQFADKIRMGVMTFDQFGSASEASSSSGAIIVTPKVCSNDPSRLCILNADCSGSATCGTVSSGQNLDGGKINYPIGYGFCTDLTSTTCTTAAECSSSQVCIAGLCRTKTSTVCTTDQNCSTNQICAPNGPGDHPTAGSLINSIDNIKANAWTPFAESFYNAIGYFGRTSSGQSRTDMQLNKINTTSTDFTTSPPIDFNESLNPSQYWCQKNNILLISDGSSTADQNTSVRNLASLYSTQASLTEGTCSYYQGSKDLPIMSWIGKNMKISNFSLSTATTKPDPATLKGRDTISTYVVYNGGSNGLSSTDPCNSLTLLTNTATKGGTSIFQAEDPSQLGPKIEAALKEIAAGSASGTAASIVSNRGQSGANLITAIFYPAKDFGNDQKVSWIGDLQNYWYYFDPYIANSTIREDTTTDNILNLGNDYRIDFVFDNNTNKTMANRYQDNLNGTYTLINQVSPDALKALWMAGVKLYERNLTVEPRTIYINKGDSSLFSLTNNKFPTLTSAWWTDLKSSLQAADDSTATNIMKYVYGYDITGYRNRTVSNFAGVTTADATTGYGVWKLGDVITSTPKVQSDKTQSGYHLDYGDTTYKGYISTSAYTSRGMVYVGANDGMLHAFKLGKVSKGSGGIEIAQLGDSGTSTHTVGTEEWAFIPQNALPYLKYFTDPNYTHLYYVDNSTLLVDASINKPMGCGSDYWNCTKVHTTTTSSWKSVLIGSMGLGGASQVANSACSGDCVKAPINQTGFTNLGLSSFFALDVTNPEIPTKMWEFTDPDLGYTISEPAIIRINGKNSNNLPDPEKNGRWYLVFASGPDGPIDSASHQFYGKTTANRNLKIYVLDLNNTGSWTLGTNYWVLDTLTDGTKIANAFGSSLSSNAVDTDKNNKYSPGYYSTDVVYIGYTQKAGDGTWTDGGLLRLVPNEDVEKTPDYAGSPWRLSKVIDGVGPVTASIDRLYDDNGPDLWLYFGSGRYFYKNTTDGIDSADNRMSIYGIKEPCYSVTKVGSSWNKSSSKDINPECDVSLSTTFPSDLLDQTVDSSISTSLGTKKGWKIQLDVSDTYNGKDLKAERVITTPSVKTNGLVLFTTYKPTLDPCGFGGETLFWFVDYGTGGAPPLGTLKGKITIQLSTGAIKVVDLSKLTSGNFARGGRQVDVDAGKPPSPPPPADTLKKPVKKILHIQEK